jgi:hypothetical protein
MGLLQVQSLRVTAGTKPTHFIDDEPIELSLSIHFLKEAHKVCCAQFLRRNVDFRGSQRP